MSRNTTLTKELADKFEFYWQLSAENVTDEQLCDKIGVSFAQLRGWLQRNQRPRLLDGTLASEGLRDIRARAKASIIVGYLMRMGRIADLAEASGDYGTALRHFQWLLCRQFPEQFAERRLEPGQAASGTTGVIKVPEPAANTQEWLKRKQIECHPVPQLPPAVPPVVSPSLSGSPTPAAKPIS